MTVKLMISYKLHDEISKLRAEYYDNESKMIEVKAKNLVNAYPGIKSLSNRQFAELIVNGYGHHLKYTRSTLKDEFRFNENTGTLVDNIKHIGRIVGDTVVVAWDSPSTGKLETYLYPLDEALEYLNTEAWIIKEDN